MQQTARLVKAGHADAALAVLSLSLPLVKGRVLAVCPLLPDGLPCHEFRPLSDYHIKALLTDMRDSMALKPNSAMPTAASRSDVATSDEAIAGGASCASPSSHPALSPQKRHQDRAGRLGMWRPPIGCTMHIGSQAELWWQLLLESLDAPRVSHRITDRAWGRFRLSPECPHLLPSVRPIP